MQAVEPVLDDAHLGRAHLAGSHVLLLRLVEAVINWQNASIAAGVSLFVIVICSVLVL